MLGDPLPIIFERIKVMVYKCFFLFIALECFSNPDDPNPNLSGFP